MRHTTSSSAAYELTGSVWTIAKPICAIVAISSILACGKTEVQCAEGTVLTDGVCLAEVSACGPGTTNEDGACVPLCGVGQWWDGDGCEPVPDCGPNTIFDESSGSCVLPSDFCAPGTAWDGERCVTELTCGTGTVLEDGECVPERLPPGMISAGEDPDALSIDLPAAGEELTVSGRVDTPVDLDGDGMANADWDGFEFEARAGTWLRISLASDGHAHPAFMLRSTSTGPNGGPRVIRYHIKQDTQDSMREVLLPFDDTYQLWVSHYDHVLANAFGVWTVPVGGEAFDYLLTIENPGDLQPTVIDELPFTEGGSLGDGALRIFAMEGVQAGEVFSFTSHGLPPGALETNVYGALTVIGPSGDVLAYEDPIHRYMNADHLVVAKTPGRYTAVVDWFVIDGPMNAYGFAARRPTQRPCAAGCASGSLAEGEEVVLRWDLSAGDLMGVAVGKTQSTEALLTATLYGPNGERMSNTIFPTPVPQLLGAYYSDSTASVYLWLREIEGGPVAGYVIDDLLYPTPRLTEGQLQTNIPVVSMPGHNVAPAGISHFVAEPNRIVMLDRFDRHEGQADWQWTEQEILWPNFYTVGPTIDVNGMMFPESYISPPFAYVTKPGHHLHFVQDRLGDISQGTYDVRLTSHGVTEMEPPVVSSPSSLGTQRLERGMRFYKVDGLRSRNTKITVSPGLLSTNLQPDVWVFTFGQPAWDWIRYVWQADASSPRLGAIKRKASADGGQAVSLDVFSPYDGPLLMLIQDAGSASAVATYSVTVSMEPPPPNDTCQTAATVSLAGGSATISGNSKNATDAVSSAPCTGSRATGVDTFYRVQLSAGDTITITSTHDFPALLYLLDGCGDPAASCVAGVAQPSPATLEYTVPDGAGGAHIIGVDSLSRGGEYSLDIQVTN